MLVVVHVSVLEICWFLNRNRIALLGIPMRCQDNRGRMSEQRRLAAKALSQAVLDAATRPCDVM
jgi:hypothetical protein